MKSGWRKKGLGTWNHDFCSGFKEHNPMIFKGHNPMILMGLRIISTTTFFCQER